MGATFSRIKTFQDDTYLTAADLNNEFDNILNNLTPDGIDDASSNVSSMQAETDPYPSQNASLPTNLTGEIQRLRYVIRQLSQKTYWYQDPDPHELFACLTLSAGQTISDNTVTKVAFDERVFDSTSPDNYQTDITNGRLIINTTYKGYYLIHGQLTFDGSLADTSEVKIFLRSNSASQGDAYETEIRSVGSYSTLSFSRIFNASNITETFYFYMDVIQVTGGNLSILPGVKYTNLGFFRLW